MSRADELECLLSAKKYCVNGIADRWCKMLCTYRLRIKFVSGVIGTILYYHFTVTSTEACAVV